MLGMVVLAVLQLLAAPPLSVAAQSVRYPGLLTIQAVKGEIRGSTAYIVFLDKRLAVDELDTLSHRIRRSAPKTELLLISFFLRGMSPQQEAWATSYFTPKLDGFVVRINEATTAANPPDADLQTAGR
jgi:hypothetical protein